MVDQREAVAVTTELTDRVYLVRPAGIQTITRQQAANPHFTSNLFDTTILKRTRWVSSVSNSNLYCKTES